MKCQKCDKPATFHITDLTGGEAHSVHLCPNCAKSFLQNSGAPAQAPVATNAINKQLKIGQTAQELAELDGRQCPVCGISFYEFRQAGRLGCPHDYEYFSAELEPLLNNVHDAIEHVGKRPRRGLDDTRGQADLIRLRREMREAVDREEYELASEIRDRIKSIEGRPIEGGPQP
jgi:protein arginine kinase activator